LKVALSDGVGGIRVEERESVPLGDGEVRVKVRAALLNPGDAGSASAIGGEFAGIISEVGRSVTDWSAGERVTAAASAPCGECPLCLHEQEGLCEKQQFLSGACAEEVVVPARIVATNLHRLKPETDFADAALIEPLARVVQGVAECRLWPGDRLLVMGADSAGLMLVKLAHHLGCHVTIVDRDAARLSAAKQFGAHHLVVASDDADVVTAVRDCPATGHGFDVVVETLGRVADWEAAIDLARRGGLVNFFGRNPGGAAITFSADRLHRAGITIKAGNQHTPHAVGKALEFIERGVVAAADLIGRETPLEQLPDARVDASGKTLVCFPDPGSR
jgi:L-iditol 2-dehydrogenase